MAGRCSEVRAGLFYPACSEKDKRKWPPVGLAKLRLDIRPKKVTVRVARHWNRLPREVVEPSP